MKKAFILAAFTFYAIMPTSASATIPFSYTHNDVYKMINKESATVGGMCIEQADSASDFGMNFWGDHMALERWGHLISQKDNFEFTAQVSQHRAHPVEIEMVDMHGMPLMDEQGMPKMMMSKTSDGLYRGWVEMNIIGRMNEQENLNPHDPMPHPQAEMLHEMVYVIVSGTKEELFDQVMIDHIDAIESGAANPV